MLEKTRFCSPELGVTQAIGAIREVRGPLFNS